MPKLYAVNIGAEEKRRLRILAGAELRSDSDFVRQLINEAWDKSTFRLPPAAGGKPESLNQTVKDVLYNNQPKEKAKHGR